MMNAVKCPHCETILEFDGPNGTRLRFTKHDDAFCRDAVLILLKAARDALRQARMDGAAAQAGREAARRDEYVMRRVAERCAGTEAVFEAALARELESEREDQRERNDQALLAARDLGLL
jgi:non-ribosomal peptide synthetase component F